MDANKYNAIQYSTLRNSWFSGVQYLGNSWFAEVLYTEKHDFFIGSKKFFRNKVAANIK